MAYDVIPTATFQEGYDGIIGYHVDVLHAPEAARHLMESVSRVKERLSDNPHIRAVSKKSHLFDLDLREYPVRNFVLAYRIEDGTVYFEHIFHQSQDFERLLASC